MKKMFLALGAIVSAALISSCAGVATNYGGPAGLILVNKASDDVGDYTYEFEYTLVNTGTSQAEVAVDVSGFTVPEGWVMFYKLENDIGTYIHAPAATESIAPGSTSF